MADKPVKVARVPHLIPQPGGRGALLSGGRPGNPGGGRPPDQFKAMCRDLASKQDVMESVSLILSDPDHPLFLGALKWASEHGYGKPNQPLEHNVGPTLEQLVAGSRRNDSEG